MCVTAVTAESPKRQKWRGVLESTSRTPWWVGAVSDDRPAPWEAIRA